MENTLYYTLSTIAQVQAALVALIGVFLFFKLQRIYDIQVGQGKAIFQWRKKEITKRKREQPDNLSSIENSTIRLGDAIYRNNLYGVEEGILNYSIEEIENNRFYHPTGFNQNVLPKFRATKRFYNQMRLFSAIVLILSILSLLFAVISLSLVKLYESIIYLRILLVLNVLFFVVTVVLSTTLIVYLLFKNLPFESHKIEECQKLEFKLKQTKFKHNCF